MNYQQSSTDVTEGQVLCHIPLSHPFHSSIHTHTASKHRPLRTRRAVSRPQPAEGHTLSPRPRSTTSAQQQPHATADSVIYPEAVRAAKYLVAGPKLYLEGAGGTYSYTRGGNKAGRVARSAVWFLGGVGVRGKRKRDEREEEGR